MAGKTVKRKKGKTEAPEVEPEPIDHVLVPAVEVVQTEELKVLAEDRGITRDKLPLIYNVDPAIAFLKLSSGQVVKFQRKSLVTGQEAPYYRLVVGE